MLKNTFLSVLTIAYFSLPKLFQTGASIIVSGFRHTALKKTSKSYEVREKHLFTYLLFDICTYLLCILASQFDQTIILSKIQLET